ncbi:MAG: flavin reductase family protein [Acidimicrobiia bacterium]|nr:flavin reductase family protein [Acidimicrobiia bacterium]
MMGDGSVAFDPGDLPPIDGYKLLTGLVVPRPIGWIGTRAPDGTANLAPFSFFNAVAATPPILVFSPMGPSHTPKDTLANVRATRVFTHNVVTEDVMEAMNLTAANLAAHEDEFEHAGLTAVPSDLIDAPRVGEARASFECRVLQILELGRPPMSGNLVVGEVIRIHIDPDLLDGTRIRQDALGAVGRMAGMEYTHTTDLFSITRPR